MTSETYERLVSEGPTPVGELPRNIHVQEKQKGISVFKPGTGNRGATEFGGGRKTRICYLIGRHDPKTVVEKWVDCNPDTVKNHTKIGLHKQISNYGDEFKKASYEILGPFDIGKGHGDGVAKMDCPFCGETDIQSVPKHLPNCENKP